MANIFTDVLMANANISGSSIAIMDSMSGSITYGELRATVRDVAKKFNSTGKALVFHFIRNRIDDVIILLAALDAGCTVALINPDSEYTVISGLISTYSPDWIIVPEDLANTLPLSGVYEERLRHGASVGMFFESHQLTIIHPANALMLSTSGSTGSPKFVRLSVQNIVSNSDQITESLNITTLDCAIAHLPIHYSFGLSVLFSHLHAGARVLLSDLSFTDSKFWDAIRTFECTSLSGVPFHYEMLRRLDLNKLNVPTITTLTQAGGRLAPKQAIYFSNLMKDKGGRFFVMYGQTEASPRMSVLKSEDIFDYPESVGTALKGGSFKIVNGDDQPLPCGEAGEIIYTGPNVMLGYAQNREDLAVGDVTGSVLRTGDLGYLDNHGHLFVTGRSSRIGKVLGLRLNLDEIEAMIDIAQVAVVEVDAKLYIYIANKNEEENQSELRAKLSRDISIHPSLIFIRSLAELPKLPNGKTNYSALRKLCH